MWALGDCTNPGCVQIYWVGQKKVLNNFHRTLLIPSKIGTGIQRHLVARLHQLVRGGRERIDSSAGDLVRSQMSTLEVTVPLIFKLRLRTAANRGEFCINVPSFGTTLGGSDCSAGKVTQEVSLQKPQDWHKSNVKFVLLQFQFKCETCSSATAPIGTSCQVESWDWGQCVTSNGLGEDLSLTSCDSSSSTQVGNIFSPLSWE